MQPPVPPTASKPRRPPVRLTRTLGTLTIIYALLLLLYGALSAAMIVGFPSLGKLMQEIQSQQTESLSTRRQSALEEIKRREAEAMTPSDKANLAVDRILLEDRREPALPAMGVGFGMFNSPPVRQFLWIQIATMALLNVLLLVAGIGLVGIRSWGSKLAKFVSVVKIPALIGFTLFAIVQVTPQMADAWTVDVKGMIDGLWGGELPPQANVQEWETYQRVMTRALGTLLGLYGVYGLVFPIALLLTLRGRRVRQELAAAKTA